METVLNGWGSNSPHPDPLPKGERGSSVRLANIRFIKLAFPPRYWIADPDGNRIELVGE